MKKGKSDYITGIAKTINDEAKAIILGDLWKLSKTTLEYLYNKLVVKD